MVLVSATESDETLGLLVEAVVTGSLEHPNVVGILDIGEIYVGFDVSGLDPA